MSVFKFRVLFLCFLVFIPTLAFSDMVYLKNENAIEGIIEKEDGAKITLNIGYGKITLDKKDIEYIYRYNPAEQDALRKNWSYLYFMRPEFIPRSLKDLAQDFNNLDNLRDLAKESKKASDKTKTEIENLENELEKLNANLVSISKKLVRLKPEDNLAQYNSFVDEFNSLLAKIRLAEYNKGMLWKQIVTLDQKISEYINDFSLLKKRFKEMRSVLEGGLKEKDRYFFEAVNNKLDEMGSDFTRHTIDYHRYGLSIVVDCLLNGSVKANLILDTGSTLVVISKNIADKLGIDMSKRESSILITLADGRKAKASTVILERMKVKDVELKNVQAAVLENSEASEEDGLLGMSFLENFLVSIDVKGNRLILEEFNP